MTAEHYCSCGDELCSDAELASGVCATCNLLQESDMHILLIAGIKELGGIAECLIQGDHPGHWKNKVNDLCEHVIQPMLTLAETDFETACKHADCEELTPAEMVA